MSFDESLFKFIPEDIRSLFMSVFESACDELDAKNHKLSIDERLEMFERVVKGCDHISRRFLDWQNAFEDPSRININYPETNPYYVSIKATFPDDDGRIIQLKGEAELADYGFAIPPCGKDKWQKTVATSTLNTFWRILTERLKRCGGWKPATGRVR